MATTTKALSCPCGREIPVFALWSAISLHARLACSVCKRYVTSEYITERCNADQKVRAILLIYAQIIRYGWTSSASLENDGVQLDPRVVGGLLSGLQRAGLIQRINPAPKIAALDIVEPRPVFVRGPRFPIPKDLHCQPIPEGIATARS